jgi:poly(3-hydroxyalkanoate) synthetase
MASLAQLTGGLSPHAMIDAWSDWAMHLGRAPGQRYFLGEPNLPTDITVWVNDTTRKPAQMHSEYLRGIFLENRIAAGRFSVAGRVIALKDLSAPGTYIHQT